MFTGLVEEVGTLRARAARGPGARLAIASRFEKLVLGESIAVDGVCLTVETITPFGFEADASSETLERTTLGAVTIGGALHLERATPLGGRMGGHIVTGHVDARGTLLGRTPVGDGVRLAFGFPATLGAFIAEKGSIAVSGVSLTVNGVGKDQFDVTIVPHTRAATHLDALALGATVNLEVDPLARYVVRALSVLRAERGPGEGCDLSLLRKLEGAGYL